MFTQEKTRGEPFKGSSSQETLLADPDPYPFSMKTLPPNSSVDVLRRVGSTQNPSACSFALVSIVDAGPVAAPGTVFLIPADAVTASPQGVAPAAAVRDEQEARQRAAQAAGEEELRSGRCTEEHAAQLQRAARGFDEMFRQLGRNPSDPTFTTVGHKLVVATKDGAPLTLDVKRPGEHHLFALAYNRRTKLAVTDDQGYAVKGESEYAGLVAQTFGLASDARVVSANSGTSIGVKALGGGCTLVVVVRKD